MSADTDHAALVTLLTEHFDSTRGLTDDNAEEAEEIADVVLAAGWTSPDRRRTQGHLTMNEIAERLGVGLSTVAGWCTRYADSKDPFPEPDSPEGIRPFWWRHRWRKIKAWHGRHLQRSPKAHDRWRDGYVSPAGLGVWIRRDGWWVNKVRAGEIAAPTLFPAPDTEMQRGKVTTPLWSVQRRPEIEEWYARWSAWSADESREQA